MSISRQPFWFGAGTPTWPGTSGQFLTGDGTVANPGDGIALVGGVASAVVDPAGMLTLGPFGISGANIVAYAQSLAYNISSKEPAHVATTGPLDPNIPNVTFQTLTASAPGAFPNIDGHPVGLNDRVLVKNETPSTNNGIYELTTVGDGVTPWVLTRTLDANSANEICGAMVPIEEGAVNKGTVWLFSANSASFVFGTTAVVWTQVTVPAATTTVAGIVQLSGDIGGVFNNVTVTGLQGNTVAAGPLATGQVLRATGIGSAAFGALDLANASAVTNKLPVGNQDDQAMVGDVTGTTGASTVVALRSRPVLATAPRASQVLTYNGTSWAPADNAAVIWGPGTGIPGAYTSFSDAIAAAQALPGLVELQCWGFFTTQTASYTQPAVGATVSVSLANPLASDLVGKRIAITDGTTFVNVYVVTSVATPTATVLQLVDGGGRTPTGNSVSSGYVTTLVPDVGLYDCEGRIRLQAGNVQSEAIVIGTGVQVQDVAAVLGFSYVFVASSTAGEVAFPFTSRMAFGWLQTDWFLLQAGVGYALYYDGSNSNYVDMHTAYINRIAGSATVAIYVAAGGSPSFYCYEKTDLRANTFGGVAGAGAIEYDVTSKVAAQAAFGGTISAMASGDISGSGASIKVIKLQGNSVSAAAPSPDSVLRWNGTAWTPASLTAAPLWVPVVAGQFDTTQVGATPLVVGSVYLDPATFSGYTGCNLEVVSLVSNAAAQGTLALWNVTDNVLVASISPFSNTISAFASAAATALASLTGAKLFELRLSVNSASYSATVSMARLRFF